MSQKAIKVKQNPIQRKNRIKLNLWCWAFVSLTLIFYLLFQGYPILCSIYYSLFNWSGMTSNMTYVGLENYQNLCHENYLKQGGDAIEKISYQISNTKSNLSRVSDDLRRYNDLTRKLNLKDGSSEENFTENFKKYAQLLEDYDKLESELFDQRAKIVSESKNLDGKIKDIDLAEAVEAKKEQSRDLLGVAAGGLDRIPGALQWTYDDFPLCADDTPGGSVR